MSEQLKEALSAALDDEADEFELRRVLDEAGRNESLRETFERYQLIQAVMRGEASARTIGQRAQLQRRVRVAMDVDVESVAVEDDHQPEVGVSPAVRRGWMPRATAFVAAFGAVLAVYLGAGSLFPGVDDTAAVNDVASGALPSLTTPVTSATEMESRVAAEATPELSELEGDARQRHEKWLLMHVGAARRSGPLPLDSTDRPSPPGWEVAWLPAGFTALPAESADTESGRVAIRRYADGDQTFLLLVEALPTTDTIPAESGDGKHWVVERLVGDAASGDGLHLAAVVGELSPPAARRLLGSISLAQ